MKTVTGGVIAVKPISLPKAATLLSSFASSENGATQDVGAYLQRASAAFTELKRLHVELKETRICSDVSQERNPTRKPDPVSQDLKAEVNEREEKKKKKRKSKETIEDDDESVVVGTVKGKLKCGDEVEIENERRKEKKKKKKSRS